MHARTCTHTTARTRTRTHNFFAAGASGPAPEGRLGGGGQHATCGGAPGARGGGWSRLGRGRGGGSCFNAIAAPQLLAHQEGAQHVLDLRWGGACEEGRVVGGVLGPRNPPQ